MRPKDAKMSGKAKLFWILMLVGFACMEFPGVFFFRRCRSRTFSDFRLSTGGT